MTTELPPAKHREIPIRDLDREGLIALSDEMKLSLSGEDMFEIQLFFAEQRREPTDCELECIAQTWSEHCKHRIFGARIEHSGPDGEEVVDSLFKTYIKATTERIMARKPDFVLGCFIDNAGFIKLDEEQRHLSQARDAQPPLRDRAVRRCATPGSAVSFATSSGRARAPSRSPVARISSVSARRTPTLPRSKAAMSSTRSVSCAAWCAACATTATAWASRPLAAPSSSTTAYIYNPLVFCGTAGVIPNGDIDKEMEPGLQVVAIGGRTGRDGLHGATFSSMALDTDSHEEDQQAVQIGNPIEEKKAADFILEARARGLIVFITDCGAGGFSSAAGEMLSEIGGHLYLERAPLKAPNMLSWEIFLSESQERMVLAVKEESLPELRELAETYETELTVLGESDDSGILKVWHDGHLVCELDNSRLHEAPIRQLKSDFKPAPGRDDIDLGERGLLSRQVTC